MKCVIPMVASVVLAVSCAGAPAAEKDPNTRPPAPPKRTPVLRIRKTTEPTEAEIARNRRQAMEWFHKARKEVVASLHLVETPHFLIFSAWSPANDRRLGRVCETMYTHLRKQFRLPAEKSVWAGKLPIYVFGKVEHFRKFTEEVDERNLSESGGYLSQRSDGFCYMVLNRVHSRTHFYGLLVHEGTHAFLARYLTNAYVVEWVNEGLAETISARLVPGCRAAKRYVEATKEAIRTGRDVRGVFDDVTLDDFDYGIAQSLVRFLLARDASAMIEFVKHMKHGADDAEALKKAYGFTPDQLVIEWRKAAAKALRR